MNQNSLDFIEKQAYAPKPSPMESAAKTLFLQKAGKFCTPQTSAVLSLDGDWQLKEGYSADLVKEPWTDAITARVPGSIHQALLDNQIISDPSFAKNDSEARAYSFKSWWMAKDFDCDLSLFMNARLSFLGVCECCDVWLNNQFLGTHKGMFGGPVFDVNGILREHNRLIVHIYPIASRKRRDYELSPFFDEESMNLGWLDSVTFNCVYGWHYGTIPAQGIWQSVCLQSVPAIEIKDPFAATYDVSSGTVDLALALDGPEGGFDGNLRIEIAPDNFEGESFFCEQTIHTAKMHNQLHYRFQVPDARLWWPNDFGEPNLYRMTLTFTGSAQGQTQSFTDVKEVTFGIRSIEHLPLPEGARPDKYEWLFCINGKPMFIKGVNWCTIDYLMDFSREHYDRFLTLAKNQHVQLLRAWGGGLVETDTFYDLCDRKGLMVFQEWPTAWDSQKWQPPAALIDTVKRGVLRLRSHPSLVLWCGGNESENPTDAVMDMMAKYTYELDGTRRFHKGEARGGSFHTYDVYWGRKEIDHNLHVTPDFIGEFGLASSPNMESVRRYLPESALSIWPPSDHEAFAYHTPVFNQKNDLSILMQYANVFSHNRSAEEFCEATQIAQATGIRHTLELARTRFPECAGACYYKLTDVFPSISWSSVDYYGVPKFSYYILQDAYEPLAAVVLFDRLNFQGKAVSLPVCLLNDTQAFLGAWKVTVKAYDAKLSSVAVFEKTGNGSTTQVTRLGNFVLTEEMTDSCPLFVTAEISCAEKTVRSFYWLNYEDDKNWRNKLPATQLTWRTCGSDIEITNKGDVPAVAVHLLCEKISDSLTASDNFFWLEPGETKRVAVNRTDIDGVAAWNA